MKDAAKYVVEDVMQYVAEDVLGAAEDGSVKVLITPPEATNTGPGLTGGPGAAPGGVTSKNGQGHMRVWVLEVSYSSRCLRVCVCVCPGKKNCHTAI